MRATGTPSEDRAGGSHRQRHPERTAFYQCLEDYWQEFKDSYSYFYESESASLRPLMEKTVQPFLMMIDRRPQLV